MVYEHIVDQEHTVFWQRIVIFFIERNTNYEKISTSSLSDHIGYLQLLVAVVTIAIGGIALINFVTSREALKEIKNVYEEHDDTLKKHEVAIEANKNSDKTRDKSLNSMNNSKIESTERSTNDETTKRLDKQD